ncbi:MAG: hypothetical protein J6T28_10840 [Paludibacteraceae bacterium]|nr:hypothetical protein [Paludibacteraceae bacterium]
MVQFKAVYLRMILAIMILSLNNGCSPQKDKSQSNEQVESVPKVNLKGINDTFVVHKLDYEKIVRYSEVLDSEMLIGVILCDSIIEKIREVKSPIIKIELFDGGYDIVECKPIECATLITGCIYSYYLDDEGEFIYKGVMAYRWVGGTRGK